MEHEDQLHRIRMEIAESERRKALHEERRAKLEANIAEMTWLKMQSKGK